MLSLFVLWVRAARSVLIVLSLLLLGAPARANDSASVGDGGSWRFMGREHRDIAMESERVLIEVFDARYRVTADFVFRNHGRETEVFMGFPEEGMGVDVEAKQFRNRSGFLLFDSWVDGSKVKISRQVTDEDNQLYRALWVKKVAFIRGQTRRVRVQYVSDYGGDSSGYLYANYRFSGGNWKGKVRESRLTVRVLRAGTTLVSDAPSEVQTRVGREFRYVWRNWEAEKRFSFYFHSGIAGALYDGGNSEIMVSNSGPAPSYQGLPFVSARPDGVLQRGRLWVSTEFLQSKLKCRVEWDEKRKSVSIERGKNRVWVSAQGSAANAQHLDKLDPTPFWLRVRGGTQLFVPASSLEKALRVRFVTNAGKRWIRVVPQG